jgi:hypothetical protein
LDDKGDRDDGSAENRQIRIMAAAQMDYQNGMGFDGHRPASAGLLRQGSGGCGRATAGTSTAGTIVFFIEKNGSRGTACFHDENQHVPALGNDTIVEG